MNRASPRHHGALLRDCGAGRRTWGRAIALQWCNLRRAQAQL